MILAFVAIAVFSLIMGFSFGRDYGRNSLVREIYGELERREEKPLVTHKELKKVYNQVGWLIDD